MSYWQSPSPEFRVRLEELSTLLLTCRDAFHETAHTFHWTPAPGSPAAEEFGLLPSPDTLVPEPHGGETGHRLLAEIVQIFLLTASDHLGGLASLYAKNEVMFSSPLLVRAIIENCAHAIWVLGEEGELAEERIARCYLEELKSAEEAKKNFGYMHGKAHQSHAQASEEYSRMKKQILARFPDASKEMLGEGKLNDQRLPRLEECVRLMYSLTEAAGGTITQEQASGIYGYLSNMTHPTLYPARARRKWVHDETSGHAVAIMHISIGSIENDARAALAAFYNALNYVTSYFGWPATIMDTLEAKIEAIIPTFFR